MPHPFTGEVELAVTAETSIVADVIDSVYVPIDGAYHYKLQCTMTDGDSAATVKVVDVHQSLVSQKEG